MFDHGCDAFSVGFILTISAKLLNMGDNLMTLCFIAGSNAIFHFATLEEYYVGGLWLGPFNCITDLCFPLIALWFYCGAFGNEWTQTEIKFTAGLLFDDMKALQVI